MSLDLLHTVKLFRHFHLGGSLKKSQMVTREFNLDSGWIILSTCNFVNETHIFFLILKEVETRVW